MARKIRTGDLVQVISGPDSNPPKTGKVLKVLTQRNRVIVEGVNRVWKHVRPSQRHPQGGQIQKDSPIHISNVMLVDPSSGQASRVRLEMRNGLKHRIAVSSGVDLGTIGRKS